MNTLNAHADMDMDMDMDMAMDIEVDDDEFGDVEGRPLVGWFLMAVALVAMAFLIGAGPEASAHPVKAPAAAPAAVAAQVVAPRASADLAFGG
jgi:hypothetical protein